MLSYGIENKTAQEIDHHTILKYLETNGYSDDVLMTMFNDDKIDTTDICEFNCTLRKLNKNNKIPMFDILVYIEKNFIDGKKIWDVVLDDRNKAMIKEQVKRQYHIKEAECSLSDMFNG